MTWLLKSIDGSVSINLNITGGGGASGTLTVTGIGYGVSGGWAASGSGSNRRYSVFNLHGAQPHTDASWVGATGRMDGSSDFPWGIQIAGATCNAADYAVPAFDEILLPQAISSASLVAGAYAESSVVVVLDASDGETLTCTACYIHNVDGSFSAYPTAGILSGIDPVTINLPKHQPKQKPNGSACILFHADASHFADPPLAEAHHQIFKVLFDPTGTYPANTTGLVLEYYNGLHGIGAEQTQTINFRHVHGPLPDLHTSVVIKP